MNRSISLAQYLPILKWGKQYDKTKLTDDSMASVIVAIMLIPQALALLGSGLATASRDSTLVSLVSLSTHYLVPATTLSVGPVAVLSLMTAAALAKLGLDDPGQVVAAALTLAFLSGCLLVGVGSIAARLYGKFPLAPCYQCLHNGERDNYRS